MSCALVSVRRLESWRGGNKKNMHISYTYVSIRRGESSWVIEIIKRNIKYKF